jgi:ectoine hydroxylase-related dioxygenase (phytanoyl-CoA dioxygenase family)
MPGRLVQDRMMRASTFTAIVSHVLDDAFLISSYTANIARKGSVRQTLHADQQFMPENTPFMGTANRAIMLSDFTEENGATRVIPDRISAAAIRNRGRITKPSPARGPAGTMLFFDGRLWHGTGASTSDHDRFGLLAYCCRPFISQQENLTISIAPEVLEGAVSLIATCLQSTQLSLSRASIRQ